MLSSRLWRRMSIGLFLSPEGLDRARQSMPSQTLEVSRSPNDFIETIRQRRHDVIILDPTLLDDSDVSALLGAIAQFETRLILYSRLSPVAARRIVELASPSVAAIVLRGFDDQPAGLANIVERSFVGAPTVRVLQLLRERLLLLPAHAQSALVGVFSERGIRSPKSLPSVAGISRRSLDRWLARSDLRPAGWFLRGADILRLASHARDALPLWDLTHAERFVEKRAVTRNVKAILDLSLGEFLEFAVNSPGVLADRLAVRAVVSNP